MGRVVPLSATTDAVRWQAIESLSVINALVCVEEDAFSKLVRNLGGTSLAIPALFHGWCA